MLRNLISKLGYRRDSPFRNSPYLDIHTPNSTIDMSQTDKPLYAVDNTGYAKVLPPFSGTHKFRGTHVRETPLQKGGEFEKWYRSNTREGMRGIPHNDPNMSYDYKAYHRDMMQGKTAYVNPNSDDHYLDTYKFPNHPSFSVESKHFTNIQEMPHALSYDGVFKPVRRAEDMPLGRFYQRGGLTASQIYSFLWDEEDEQPKEQPKQSPRKVENTAPSVEELGRKSNHDLAMNLAMQPFSMEPMEQTFRPTSRKPFSLKSQGSIAETHNNPGNIKYGNFAKQFGAVPGKPGTDGGRFAIFPDVQTGLKARQSLLQGSGYNNLTVDQAMKRWSNNGYGANIYPEIAKKKISELSSSELSELAARQIKQEDGQMYRKLKSQGLLKYGGNHR